MRFALLGNHPDGLAMARVLRATGRHEMTAYSGPRASAELLQQEGWNGRLTGDLEEVLADPAIEAILVASGPGVRAGHLRRALQSERHVLCVHPADQTPDTAYEAAMIQGDTRHVLLPLLGRALHPAVSRLTELLNAGGPLGKLQLVQWEVAGDAVLLDGATPDFKPALPIWDVLRRLGGEVPEVSAFAGAEEIATDAPVLVAGRFESGGVFQVTLLPGQPAARQRLHVCATNGSAELTGDDELSLTWQLRDGVRHEERFAPWQPWETLVEVFEAATGQPGMTGAVTWQDEVRALELDEAARRSIERRRASTLDYQEVSEEVGFKGTMTLVGCGLLWGLLLLLGLAAWDKRFLWLVVPTLVIFLALQLLRWVIPTRTDAPAGADRPPGSP